MRSHQYLSAPEKFQTVRTASDKVQCSCNLQVLAIGAP